MPGLPQDFYKKVGANTVTTLAAPGKNLAATSINVGATTNYPTDTGIVVGIRVVDSNGTIVPGTYTEWNAVVASSTAITIEAVPVYGTDQVYPAGSLTQVFLMVSSSLHNQMVDGLLVSHDQDGKLKAGAISNSNMLANNTVTTPAITDASVTPPKWTNPYKFSAYHDATQNIVSGGTFLSFNSEEFDTNSDFSSSAYTAPVNGFYMFSTIASWGSVSGQTRFLIEFTVNGTAVKAATIQTGQSTSSPGGVTLSVLQQISSGDVVKVRGYSIGATTPLIGGAIQCNFSGYLVSQT